MPDAHSDILFLRCAFCQKFVLLARTSKFTRQFSDWGKVETFIRKHLACNPYHTGENLLGIPGFEIFTASDSIYNQARIETSFAKLNDEIGKVIRDTLGEDGEI